MNIALIVPRYISNYGEYYQFPLGFAYIASAIKSGGYNLKGLNLNNEFGNSRTLVKDFIKKNSIDVCFTGGISSFIDEVKSIFSSAREANSKIINIGGGGIIASDPLISLDLADMDYGIVGEGEFISINLLNAIKDGSPVDKIEGIVYRSKEGKIIQTKDPKTIMDLTKIPWPDYEILGYDKHLHQQRCLDHHLFQTVPDGEAPRSIDMISSRSCPFSCTFCFHPVGKVYRERPLDEFFSELEFLIKKYNINCVSILDELFSLRKQRLIEFCKRVKKYNIKWMVQLHVNSVDPNTINLMKDSGCTVISYGIESMSEPVLVSMQKKSKPKRINEVLQMTYEHKIGVQGNLIFFDTAENVETANDTFRWWANNKKYQVYLSRLQVYPGSPDYIMAVRDKMIVDRIKFSKTLPVSFNISNINNFDYDNMTFQMMIHGQTLLQPALSQEITKIESKLKRGNAWNIKMVCRHCKHESNYKECFIRPEQVNYIRIHCQNCRARIDVRNTVGNPRSNQIPLATDEAQKEIINSMGSNISDVEKDALKKQKESSGFVRKSTYERWEKLISYDYSNIEAELAGYMRELKASGIALKKEPFSAQLHCRFANALQQLKHYGAAMLHYEQAIILDSNNTEANLCIKNLQKKKDYEKYKDVYFVQHSLEKPPYRESRDKGKTYNRKDEPNFPTYKRGENRTSVTRQRLPIYFRD